VSGKQLVHKVFNLSKCAA